MEKVGEKLNKVFSAFIKKIRIINLEGEYFEKKILIFVVFLLLTSIATDVYWFIIHPKSYLAGMQRRYAYEK